MSIKLESEDKPLCWFCGIELDSTSKGFLCNPCDSMSHFEKTIAFNLLEVRDNLEIIVKLLGNK